MINYFSTNKGYLDQLIQFNNNDKVYLKILEISSSIHKYETRTRNKFFSAEVWQYDTLDRRNYPIWQIDDTDLIEKKNSFIQEIKQNKITNSNFIVYNKIFFVGVVFPIVTNRITKNTSEKQILYKIVFYKKIFDFAFFQEMNFITSSCCIIFSIFLSLLVFLSIPIHLYDRYREKNIERKVTHNIKNLIEHSLINQRNILSSSDQVEERLQRALFYNHEAQKSLNVFYCDALNPVEIIQEVWDQIYNPNHVNLMCDIDMEKKIFFDKNELFTALSNIISNALHPEVRTQNILIKIRKRNTFNRTTIDIINDGIPIGKKTKKQIFKGTTTKSDGHGIALKNIKEILLKSGNDIKITSFENKTCFRMRFKNSDVDFKIKETIHIKKNGLGIEPVQNTSGDTNRPLIVLIEDERLIWDAWRFKMHDAHILFFETPDEFFMHIQMEKFDGKDFLAKVDMIICDYDYGNNYNLSNCAFFESLDKEEAFTGKFLLCTGFSKAITDEIPDLILHRIDFIYPKKPAAYQEILKSIASKAF